MCATTAQFTVKGTLDESEWEHIQNNNNNNENNSTIVPLLTSTALTKKIAIHSWTIKPRMHKNYTPKRSSWFKAGPAHIETNNPTQSHLRFRVAMCPSLYAFGLWEEAARKPHELREKRQNLTQTCPRMSWSHDHLARKAGPDTAPQCHPVLKL